MKIYLAGKNGLVGSAICKYYKDKNIELLATTSAELDLRSHGQISDYLRATRPDVMILSAAKHGGVESYMKSPLDYYKDNLLISVNSINAAAENGVEKLINIGASCVYAEGLKGPLTEDMLFAGAVQKATEPYGMAKAAGMKLCEYYNSCRGLKYISVLPPNLYGDGAGYTPDMSSVLPAMMERFHNAVVSGMDSVTIWGSGTARREFLYVHDLVKAIDILINSDFSEPYVNVGATEMYTVNQLAELMKEITGYSGEIIHDLSKPEGAQREKLDCTKISSLGWKPEIDLRRGLLRRYNTIYI